MGSDVFMFEDASIFEFVSSELFPKNVFLGS